jgi:hypothetical protein
VSLKTREYPGDFQEADDVESGIDEKSVLWLEVLTCEIKAFFALR